jgi:hypothetical protein
MKALAGLIILERWPLKTKKPLISHGPSYLILK